MDLFQPLNIIDTVVLTEIANRFSKNYANVGHYTNQEAIDRVNQRIVKGKHYYCHPETDAEVFSCCTAVHASVLHFVFLGSNCDKDWKSNADFVPYEYKNEDIGDKNVDSHKGCYVHKGIYDQFESLKEFIHLQIGPWIKRTEKLLYNTPTVIISGHSLGGGLACLAAYYIYQRLTARKFKFSIKILTIGAPAIFSATMCGKYNEVLGEDTIRIINHLDSIPHVNLVYYQHVNAGYHCFYFQDKKCLGAPPEKRRWWTRFKSLRQKFKFHSIDKYIDNLAMHHYIQRIRLIP